MTEGFGRREKGKEGGKVGWQGFLVDEFIEKHNKAKVIWWLGLVGFGLILGFWWFWCGCYGGWFRSQCVEDSVGVSRQGEGI